LIGFGAPVVWGAAAVSAAGFIGFGAPVFAGAALALGGLRGLGRPCVLQWSVGGGSRLHRLRHPSRRGLVLAAGSAAFGAAAGLGAEESEELEVELAVELAGFGGLPAA